MKEQRGFTPAWHSLLLLILVAIAYGGSLHGEFVFDDPVLVLNVETLSTKTWSDVLQFSGTRGLLFATYRLNYLLGGTDPFGYHVGNVMIHAVNVLLVYAILLMLAPGPIYAFFGAAVFAVHTLMSSSVLYVAGRSSLLCATFYFAAIYCFCMAIMSRRWWGFAAWWTPTITAVALAWQVKQEAIMAPIFLAFIALYASQFKDWKLAVGLLIIPLFGLVAIRDRIANLYEITAISQTQVMAGIEQSLPAGQYIPSYISAVSWYVVPRFLVPVSLSVDPYVPAAGWLSNDLIAGVALLALLCMVGWECRSSYPLATLAVGALFISPLAAYSIIPMADVIQEHRLYIPGLSLAFAAALFLQVAYEKVRVRLALIVPVLAILAGMTIQRGQVWATSVSLWQDAALKAPQKARTQFNLGQAFHEQRDHLNAMRQYDIALKLQPTLYAAQSNMAGIQIDVAQAYVQAGQYDAARATYLAAEQQLLRTLRESPNYADAQVNLAVVYLRTKRSEEAEAILRGVAAAWPENFAAHFNLAEALMLQGRRDEALASYREAQRLRPDVKQIQLTIEKVEKLKGEQPQ